MCIFISLCRIRLFRTCVFVQALNLSVGWCDRRASKEGLPMLWIARRSKYHLLCYQDNKSFVLRHQWILVSAFRKSYWKAGESVWVRGNTRLIPPPFTAKEKKNLFNFDKVWVLLWVIVTTRTLILLFLALVRWHWWGWVSVLTFNVCTPGQKYLEKLPRFHQGVVRTGGALCRWAWDAFSGSTGGSWACSRWYRGGWGQSRWNGSCKDHWKSTVCSSTRWQQPKIAVWEAEREFWPGGQCVTGTGLPGGVWSPCFWRLSNLCSENPWLRLLSRDFFWDCESENRTYKNLWRQQYFFQENLKIILYAITISVFVTLVC